MRGYPSLGATHTWCEVLHPPKPVIAGLRFGNEVHRERHGIRLMLLTDLDPFDFVVQADSRTARAVVLIANQMFATPSLQLPDSPSAAAPGSSTQAQAHIERKRSPGDRN